MSSDSSETMSSARYESLGLIANPFRVRGTQPPAELAFSLEVQAESNALLAMLARLAEIERSSVVWVSKSAEIPGYYHMAAESDVEETLLGDEDLSLLPCYIQLFMARVGRIRSVLNTLAERIATRSFEQTLTAWTRSIVREPDEDIPQWHAMDDFAWDAFTAAFSDDEIGAVRDYLGDYTLMREQVPPPVADVREISLDPEPEDADDTPETDDMTETNPHGNPDVPSGEAADSAPAQTARAPEAQVREYLIAYTGAHLSPVVARALVAYGTQGFGQMIQELKITRAPRKTFKALLRLARQTFRKVVFIYDGFEEWHRLSEDVRIQYVSAVTETRLMAGKDGIIVFLAQDGEAPELEEQFGIGERLEWAFPNLVKLSEDARSFDGEIVQRWLDVATISGTRTHSLEDPAWTELVNAAAGDMERFCALAAEALEYSASHGSTQLGSEAVAAALVSMRD